MEGKKFFTAVIMVTIGVLLSGSSVSAAYRLKDFRGRPPIHEFGAANASPRGLSPEQIKAVYHLPATGGSGTIAIIGAYDDALIEHDLEIFDKEFHLKECTSDNGCFEKHVMAAGTKGNSGWSLETSLDVEWAHAIAPDAKILLVEAKTQSGPNLLAAVDYARSRPDVVAITMSWGGAEFADETALNDHLVSKTGATFFASSGDNGAGPSWPASSPNVVAVGGTSLVLGSSGALSKESAWSGSGGGVSAYEDEPGYQIDYSIPKAKKHRAIPDVSYNADPASGFSVYRSTGKSTKKGWYVLGGTSAGAPQWAAIQALGHSVTLERLYADKTSAGSTSFFRDITDGSNGDCAYYCDARKHYDFVTGLGSPLTVKF